MTSTLLMASGPTRETNEIYKVCVCPETVLSTFHSILKYSSHSHWFTWSLGSYSITGVCWEMLNQYDITFNTIIFLEVVVFDFSLDIFEKPLKCHPFPKVLSL